MSEYYSLSRLNCEDYLDQTPVQIDKLFSGRRKNCSSIAPFESSRRRADCCQTVKPRQRIDSSASVFNLDFISGTWTGAIGDVVAQNSDLTMRIQNRFIKVCIDGYCLEISLPFVLIFEFHFRLGWWISAMW